jgi:hypothetical protein
LCSKDLEICHYIHLSGKHLQYKALHLLPVCITVLTVAECCSVVMVLVIRCQILLEDLWTIWSWCLYVFYYYHILSYSLGSIFYQCIYGFIPVTNVIYVFLLIWLYIPIVCLCMTNLTKVFPCFFLSRKANARVKPAKTEHGPHSSLFLCFLCIVCFVSFSVLFVCICVLQYCHRVANQLPLNISYHIT